MSIKSTGKVRAFGIVSKGVIDDLFAARLPRHTRFRWQQARQTIKRKQLASQFASIVGNPIVAQEISRHFTNPQTQKYIVAFGNLTLVSRKQKKQLRPVLKKICLAELEGNHNLVIDLVHRVIDVENHKLR